MSDTECDRNELEHDFLDKAKAYEWDDVKRMLQNAPDLINVQPCGRWSALHQAAFSGDAAVAEELVKLGASVGSLTRQGKTPAEVAKGAAKATMAASARAAADGAAAPEAEAAKPADADTAVGPPPMKKAKKKEVAPCTLNINAALDQEFHDCTFAEVADLPTSALLGIGKKGQDTLKKFRVKTIRDLGTWKFYRMSKAMVGLGTLEVDAGRSEASAMNLNMAVDMGKRSKSLKELLEEPPSALNGIAGWADAELKPMGIKSIKDLGEWKFARWSEWIMELSNFEEQED